MEIKVINVGTGATVTGGSVQYPSSSGFSTIAIGSYVDNFFNLAAGTYRIQARIVTQSVADIILWSWSGSIRSRRV